VEITKQGIFKHEYIDLDGYVWKRQIIDREYIASDHHKSEFRTFLWLVSGKDSAKYNSFKSVIGYLMHSYKTSASNKAIIFNDETISENPNGGSGKGLFWNALAKLKKVASIDGKTFEFKLKSSFPKNISREYLLVDLLNNLDNLAEDQTQAIAKLPNNVRSFNTAALMKATQQYGTGKTKRTLKSIVRNVLQHA
jgi:hypothetical protein